MHHTAWRFFIAILFVVNLLSAGGTGIAPVKAALPTAELSALSVTPEVVDNNAISGQHNAIALDAEGVAHIAYFFDDDDGTPDGYLMMASRHGGTWQPEDVDDASITGITPSIAIDEDGLAHIAYYDQTNGNLRYARQLTPDGWSLTTVDSAGDVGLNPSLALDTLQQPRIAYRDATNGTLKVATFDGAAWQVITVPGTTNFFANGSISLALTSENLPRIAYRQSSGPQLVLGLGYAAFDGTTWTVETAFTSPAVSEQLSLALDAAGVPHLSFMDSSVGLRYIQKNPGWTSPETVVASVLAGSQNNLALDPSGLPRIVFFDSSASPYTIKYAYKDGSTWRVEQLATNAASPHLAIGPDGSAHISYQNGDNKLAYISLAPLPDLQVTDIWLDGATVYFQLFNAGSGDAPAGYKAALSVNGDKAATLDITDPIPSGGRITRSFIYPYGCSPLGAVIPVKVDADSGAVIAEITRSNNSKLESWTCKGVKPVITAGPTVSNITQTAATITWTTNTDTDGTVNYGRRAALLNGTVSNSPYQQTHIITLSSLAPAASYAFKVTSMDQVGQTVSSDVFFFTTLSDGGAVSQDVTRTITRDAGPGEVYTLKAALPAATGKEKVEFFYQLTPTSPLVLIGTAYSGTPTASGTVEFAAKFSPGKTGLNRADLANAALVTQVSVLGGSTEAFEDVLDAFTPLEPEVTITAPNPGHTIFIQGSSAPAGTTLPVSAHATGLEWECDWSGVGLAPDCDDVAHAVDKFQFTFNGYDVIYEISAFDYAFTFDIEGITPGTYTLLAKAWYNNQTKSASIPITITQGTPTPNLTRTVQRIGNKFKVNFTLSNHALASAPLVVDKIYDYTRGFQPIFDDAGDEKLTSTYTPSSRITQVVIDLDDGASETRILPPGSSYPFSYELMPIIYENSVQYAIGEVNVTSLVYKVGDDERHQYFNLPGSTLLDPSPAVVPLASSVAKALKEDDYLLVTHPANLNSVYGATSSEPNWNTLLRRMAELADLRQGALAYLDSTDSQTLNELLEPQYHTWSDKLHPNYSKYAQGYVLLVGEDNIVPSYTKTGLEGGTVPITDNPFAHTGGSGAPDLVLGRLPGNDIPQLIRPIEISLKVLRGQLVNDRLSALGTSGTGDGIQSFQDAAESAKSNLQSLGLSVTLYHTEERARTQKISIPFDDGDLLAAGDLDGDGDQELVIGDVSTDDIYIVSFTTMGFSRELWFHYQNDIKAGHGFAVGNIDTDPQAELLIADDNDMLYIFDNVSGATLNLNQPFDNWDKLTLGELDGDAPSEIIIAHGGGIISRNGDGSPSAAAFPLSFVASDDLVAGQFLDTDGIDEIALMDASENRGLIINSSGQVTAFNAVYSEGDFAIAADIDGNSRDEIWVMNSAGNSIQGYHTFAPEPKAYFIPQRVIEGDKIAAATIAGESSPAIWLVKRDDNTYQLDRDYPDYMETLYVGASNGADYLYYNGHGSSQSWENVKADMNPVPNFGTAAPLAYGQTCSSGDYRPEKSASMSERMLWWGAGAFIGSTEVSYRSFNVNAGEWFSNHIKDQGPFNRLLVEYKNKKWDDGSTYTNADWPYWVHEYNFYGDAKFGFIGDTTVLPYPDAAPKLAESTSLHVDVPLYTIFTEDGYDYVDIPGGDVTTEVGQPRIPYYVVTQEYPAGTRVTGVTLSVRSGKTTATDLNLPDYVLEIDGSGQVVAPSQSPAPTQPSAPDEIDWTPSQDEIFTWLVNERADGSSQLVLRLNPFYYSPSTAAAEFYTSYDFAIQTTAGKQEITRLESDSGVYRLGQPVQVSAQIVNNSSSPVDLLVSATLLNAAGSPVVGADMRVLNGLAGDSAAGYLASFDTTALPAGSYNVELQLRDTAGNLLDAETTELELGMRSAQGSLQATPNNNATFSISLDVTNNGDLLLSGATVELVISGADGVVVAELLQPLADLQPGASLQVPFSWNAAGASQWPYTVRARVLIGSQASPAESLVLLTYTKAFLPFTMK